MRTPAQPSPAAPRRSPALALAALLLGAGGLLLAAAPATALPRDVEVHQVGAADGTLAVAPAVRLARDVRGALGWDLVVTNGGADEVVLDLAVHHLAADDTGAPTPSADEVGWALLPRDQVVLDPGEAATFTVGLRPTTGDLPAAIALVASPEGDPDRRVLAAHVLWPVGHEPAVEVRGEGDALVVVDVAGPSLVDLRVRTSAAPLLGRTVDHGPLVLLAEAPRAIDLATTGGPWGQRVEAVAAIGGEEVARVAYGRPGLAWVGAGALLVLTAGVATGLARRRTTA